MQNKRKKENTTKYGEFVCSEYHWLPIEKQKEQAKKMEETTKKQKGQSSHGNMALKKYILSTNC